MTDLQRYMNRELENLLNVGMNESFNILAESIAFKGKTIAAIVSDIRVTEELMDGGILEKRAIKVLIQKTDFTIPKVGEKFLYNGKSFRVLELNEDVACVSWELIADSSDK